MTTENAKYLLDEYVHYGTMWYTYVHHGEMPYAYRDSKVCSSQQFRSIRGMLNSGNERAEQAAKVFIYDCMCALYTTDKAKFMFRCEKGGWSIVI